MDGDRFAADRRVALALAAINRGGSYRPIKVAPHEPAPWALAGGWFGTEIFVLGRTPEEMERILGFKAGYLRDGADIYRFNSPIAGWHLGPLTGSYTYLPGGREWDGRDRDWPPGTGATQWRLADGLRLPCTRVAHVPRGTAYRGG